MSQSEYPIVRRSAVFEAERELQRQCHTLVVREHGRWGGMPERHLDWHKDLRKGRLRIYGGLLRWIDEMVEHDAPLTRVLEILPWIGNYIRAKHADHQKQTRGRRRFRAWITEETEGVK